MYARKACGWVKKQRTYLWRFLQHGSRFANGYRRSCFEAQRYSYRTGDGSIELNIQELRTMQQNNFNIKLFIINNGGYASIRKSQDEMAGGRYTDDVDVLNFQKVAEAFDIRFHFIEEFLTLEDNLRDILSIPGPAMIELFCDKNQSILEPFADI